MSNFNNELKEYQNIPRNLIFDNTISDRARFVFCFMAAKPDDWNFYMTPMAKEIGYSVDTLRKYINELVERGWLVKGEQERLEGNLFGAVSYTLKAKIQTPKVSDTENFRHRESPAQHNIDSYRKDNNNKKKNKEDSKQCKKANVDWRGDYGVYKNECEKAIEEVYKDKDCEQNLRRRYPNMDYYRTILKSISFWESEKGWEYKKRSRSTNINMATTIKKNLDKNIEYENPNNRPIENETKLKLRIIDSNGTLEDGTTFRNGYRYCKSSDGIEYSIPVDEVARPDERWEYDFKKGWYLPEQKETLDDLLW